MTTVASAEESLRDGDPAGALARLQEQVRANPSDPKLRIFLFQLLCVLGQWDRAVTQVNVAAEIDTSALAMARTYAEAIACEKVRHDVFAGRRAPLILGQPEPWLAWLIESLTLATQGERSRSEELRLKALDESEASSGTMDDRTFAWICDADSRLGPVLEAVINGRYYWVPFARLRTLTLEAPTDLRDLVWMPAQLKFANGGESVALIPTRYPGSETAADPRAAMARATVWDEIAPDVFYGTGQRMIATDTGEAGLMEIRTITIDPASETPESGPDVAHG